MLATKAAQRALDAAGLGPNDIDLIVLGTSTPDFTFPSSATQVQAALGMTRSQVLQLFLLEGAVLGAVGAALGGLLGMAVVGWYATHGIDLTEAMEKGGANLPVSATLYLAVDPFWTVAAPAVGVAIAILSSIYPARVASAMPPAEAVRA